jgi:hypothetical protein
MAANETRRTENDEQDDPEDLYEEEITDDEAVTDARVGRSGQWGDPTEAPVVEVSLEELLERAEEEELEGDDTLGDIFDTANTDGSTENVQMAIEQGLVYTPPVDPPVVPSDDLQGVEIAAGFGYSIDDEPEVEQGEGNEDDADAEREIRKALRYNSETTHLDDVRVYVRDGIAYLRGTVTDDEDIALVEDFISDLDLVEEVKNELVTEDDL